MGRTIYPFRQSDIRAAGDLILGSIADRNGGGLPSSARAAHRLCIRGYDVDVRRSKRLTTAQLVQDFQPSERVSAYAGEWTIYYNPTVSAVRQLRFLIHELAEYIAITDHPDMASLFDNLPGSRIYHYHGGDHPHDVRHRVALYVERMYLKWLLSR